MMSFLNLCTAMNEYLYRKASIERELEEYLDVFQKEAILIGSLKCHAAADEELSSYDLPEGRVEVTTEEKGCRASFQGIVMTFEIEDGVVVSASFLQA